MDFSLTDEQEALRELARKIFADRTGHERMKALEAGDWYDAELWKELCRANLPAIALPEEVGGAGLGMVEAALALEEAAGFDPALPRATARRDGSAWRLDGEKTCVSAAKLASAILVPARIDGGGVGVFLVEPGAAGISLERQLSTHREPLSRLLLSGARAGADALLGAPERGAEIVGWVW